MNRTPFFERHKAAGARFVDFGGWEMPIQFKGILQEHAAVRERVGLFDISHMGQVWVTGPGARDGLQKLLTNDISKIAPGRGQYNLMLRDDGCVVDDLYVYQLAPEKFLVIINASRVPVDIQWMKDHLKGDLKMAEQPNRAALALQGPSAEAVLKPLCAPATALARNGVGEFTIDGRALIVARTGYTGEDGFEFFGAADALLPLYDKLMATGQVDSIGLGARDTLRLEMGYRLYGNDLDEQHTALEAGLGWVIAFDKPDFIGKDALLREKTKGSERRFVALRLKESGVPRHGHAIRLGGRTVGEVTSGTFSPSLKAGVAVGFVDARAFPKGAVADGLAVQVHGRDIPAEPATLPFYKKAVSVSA